MKEANKLEEGCGVCKSLEEEFYWNHIKRLWFCVAFRPDFRDKLQIPKKFADNVRPNILNPKLTLRGPSGATWEVNLIRSVDGLFLQDGWEDFVNAYSIQENDILFFKYDRNSSFDVKIFDGECEKEAAYFVKKCGHAYPADMNQKKRAVNEIVGDKDHGNDDEVCISTKKSCRNVFTLQLHRAMNSSPRIAKSLHVSSKSGTKSSELSKLNDDVSARKLCRVDHSLNTLESQARMESSSIKSMNVGSDDNSVNLESQSCNKKFLVVCGSMHNERRRPECDRFFKKYSRRASLNS